jgi:glycosyltransferase involved in cell wall biosynthesis
MEKALIDRARLIAVSDDLFEFLRGAHPRAEVVAIRNGIVLPPARRASVAEEVRGRYGIPGEAFWMASASRLEKVKNLTMAVDGVALARERGMTDGRFSIFGSGPEETELERRIDSERLNEIVGLQGFVDPIAPVYEAIDVFLMTSEHEGLPMALIEAMARGAVPVCTAVGGIREVVTHEVDGLLVTPGDPSSLANALIRLQRNPADRKAMAERARRTVEERFSVERGNTLLMDTYWACLSRGKNGDRPGGSEKQPGAEGAASAPAR